MLDATKSPTPAWKRYLMAALLTLSIVAAGWVVWSKELHHTTPGGPPAAAAPAPAGARPAVAHSAPVTVPGGIPISSRDPFAH